MRYQPRTRAFVAPAAILAALAFLTWLDSGISPVMHVLFPADPRTFYGDATMGQLLGQHLALVGISSALSLLVGVGLGIFVTRPAGADFFDVVNDVANFGQTFPPIAVFVLAIPLLGLGFAPTVLALTLYGVLPVLFNTIAGLRAVRAEAVESARGMGMRPTQVLWRVELPMAAPVIVAGVRVSVVVNVSTATLGAIAGAGGLGAPIISGMVNQDPAVTLQGALMAALLALGLDGLIAAVGTAWSRTARAASTP